MCSQPRESPSARRLQCLRHSRTPWIKPGICASDIARPTRRTIIRLIGNGQWDPKWSGWFHVAWGVPGFLLADILRRQRKLAVEGEATIGTATSCSPVSSGFQTAYEFCAPDGSTVNGSGWSPGSIHAGSRIDLLFLPGDPLKSLPYP